MDGVSPMCVSVDLSPHEPLRLRKQVWICMAYRGVPGETYSIIFFGKLDVP